MIKSKYGNLSQQFLKLVYYTLRPWFRLEVKGKEHLRRIERTLDEKVKIIVATTHANVLRSIAAGLALGGRIFSLVVNEEWSNKWAGPFLRLMNCVMVYTPSKEASQEEIYGCNRKKIQTAKEMIEVLKSDSSPQIMLMAPIGRFNFDDEEDINLRRGIALTAYRASHKSDKEIYILPMVEKIGHLGFLGFIGKEYVVKVLPPIYSNGRNPAEILDVVQEQMRSMYR